MDVRVGLWESWVLKNWCFWTVVLEKTLESPLDCKEIQPVHSKGDQFWVFIGRNDAKAETPVLWPSHAKSWLIGKDPDAGRDCGQEEKGMTEDKMAGCHHRLDGHEFEWTPGVGDGQGGLVCCDSWGRKESDTTEWLNWTEQNKPLCWLIFLSVIVKTDSNAKVPFHYIHSFLGMFLVKNKFPHLCLVLWSKLYKNAEFNIKHVSSTCFLYLVEWDSASWVDFLRNIFCFT